ncbi:helix-turn-helix transcriptional regulator [Wukongibacter baidiensis]|uniref:helix-turn-helix domain-containing protein n=1 Tax=Wukongibacter baidiensis TaxID=1723361 RepID=UPI003D7F382E
MKSGLVKDAANMADHYERIRDLREYSDATQREIANVLSCSQTGYVKYAIGLGDIPTEILIKLAKHYNTRVDYILGLADEKDPYPPSKLNKDWACNYNFASHFY